MTSTGVAFGSMACVRTTIKTVTATSIVYATPYLSAQTRSSEHDRLTLPEPCHGTPLCQGVDVAGVLACGETLLVNPGHAGGGT